MIKRSTFLSKLKIKKDWTTSLFAVFCLILGSIILYIFYGSELRLRLEHQLFDLVTIYKPVQKPSTSSIRLVTIDEEDIQSLEAKSSQKLSSKTLQKMTNNIKASGAKAIIILLPRQDYDYDDPEMKFFFNEAKNNDFFYIGTYDYTNIEPSDSFFSKELSNIDNKALEAGTLRRYRQGVVRRMPILSYKGTELKPTVMMQVALDLADQKVLAGLKEQSYEQLVIHKNNMNRRKSDIESVRLPTIRLNYFRPEHLKSLKAKEIFERPYELFLKDKVVLVGYTAFRPRTIDCKEGTFVNTPWEGEQGLESQGKPLLYVQAVTLNNMLTGTWLTDVSVYINMIQSILLTFLSFIVWSVSPAFAALVFLGLCIFFTLIHGILYEYFNLFIPLADSLLFSFFATIIGAFFRARIDSQKFVMKEHRANSQKHLAKIQSRFLNKFSLDIDKYNDNIIKILSSYQNFFQKEPMIETTFQKTLNSSFELKEYLEGIKQVAQIGENDSYKVQKKPALLKPVVLKILSRFETTLELKKMNVNVNVKEKEMIITDLIILEPILFNLISNAIKYTPDQGKIEISYEKIKFSIGKINIKDNGVGIPFEFQKKIFEKFYRIKNDEVYKIKGNGLGLYLCQYFAEKLNSKIDLLSEAKKGSIFSIQVEC